MATLDVWGHLEAKLVDAALQGVLERRLEERFCGILARGPVEGEGLVADGLGDGLEGKGAE